MMPIVQKVQMQVHVIISVIEATVKFTFALAQSSPFVAAHGKPRGQILPVLKTQMR